MGKTALVFLKKKRLCWTFKQPREVAGFHEEGLIGQVTTNRLPDWLKGMDWYNVIKKIKCLVEGDVQLNIVLLVYIYIYKYQYLSVYLH